MTVARDVMTQDATCVQETDTIRDAATRLAELGVGAMPICGEDNRLKGMLTDRDIVIRCVAEGGDCMESRAGEFAQGSVHWVSADADIDDALAIASINNSHVPNPMAIATAGGEKLRLECITAANENFLFGQPAEVVDSFLLSPTIE